MGVRRGNVTVPELANYGSLPYLETELKKFIKDKQAVNDVMEILTSPENPSFYQIEEIELWRTRDLKKHAKKYFWLKNSYNGVEVVGESFFSERKRVLKTDPKVEFDKHRDHIINRKNEIINKYKLPEIIKNIADAIVFGIEWQDDRKKHIWIYLHYKSILLSKSSEYIDQPFGKLLNFREIEIESMLKGTMNVNSTIASRSLVFGFLCINSTVTYISEENASVYWNTYIDVKADKNLKKFSGIVASKGLQLKTVGKVRILMDPNDAHLFEFGEILVAPMTTPEYVFAMKKSIAVITDVGGLTSHAAIVSRELKKPCIIGTKLATKILKNGDLVEVDVEKGMVKILK